MDVLVFNLQWVGFNVFLALIPIVFGALMFKTKSTVIKLAAGFIWFIFLPNTIYLLTDITHLFEDAQKLAPIYLLWDTFLYLSLIPIGITTFILAIDPFEKMLFRNKSKKKIKDNLPRIYILNFFVGFGVVLGWVHRANSWEVFTDTQKVITSSLNTLGSWELMVLVLVFSAVAQLVYLKFKKPVLRIVK
mgnify:CR=1 FL=1